MKTILVPTDFSAASGYAVDYAAGLCSALGAKLILFNAYMLPVPVSEVPFIMITAEEMQTTSEDQLRQEAERLFNKSGIEIEWVARMGLAVDEIRDLEKERNADLLVMGTKNAEGMGKLPGSTTNAIIRSSRKPVLVIPETVTFSGIKNISYATDFDFQMKLQCFEPLLTLLREFKAKLTIIHIKKEGKELTADQNAGKSRLESIWSNLEHEYRIIEYANFEDGLLNYLGEENTDLLAVVAHKHNFIERMFGRHTSRTLSEKTQLPLIILQDKE